MPFYLIDAFENPDRPDVLYLFGKAWYRGKWSSCCTLVPNMHRSLLVVPAPHVFADPSGELAALEAAAKDAAAAAAAAPASAGAGAAEEGGGEGGELQAAAQAARLELLKALHARAADLKAELRALLLRQGVRSMRVVPVRRNYAFEDPSVPHGEQWVLKVRYPAAEPTLMTTLKGEHFRAVFNTRQSLLEALVLKRRVMGPGWVLLQAPRIKEGSAMVSWCKLEVELSGPKALLAGKHAGAAELRARRPPPPLTAAALNLRLHTNPQTQQPEILAASVVHLAGVSPDSPMPREEWSSPQLLRNFTVVRKLDGHPWPPGYEASVAADNASPRGRLNGGSMVVPQPNERALLGCLLAKLQALDADVLVGHNISAFDLSVLLHRLQALKVPLWSRVGRLRRNTFPKLTGGGHIFGGGASAGLLTCLAGRLLCDTYLS
ncbi:DNA polymerase alpha subunit A, partial [Monoraphidium neglectum]